MTKWLLIGLIGIGLLVFLVDRLPLYELIVSTKHNYKREDVPGLYTIPDIEKDLSSISCSFISAFDQRIHLGTLFLFLPKEGLLQIKDKSQNNLSPIFHITYSDGRTFVVTPVSLDLNKLLPAKEYKHEFNDWFFAELKLSDRKEILEFILSVSPDNLSFFDKPIVIISKNIALRFKYSMVPLDATEAYRFNINNRIAGFQFGSENDRGGLIFVHVIDKKGKHLQLTFKSFKEREISCILKYIQPTDKALS
ncbi:MAG: hypothetical protein ACREYF_14825 [Gammaproteobacteria bacterium]